MSIKNQHHTAKANNYDYWNMLLQHNDEITWDLKGKCLMDQYYFLLQTMSYLCQIYHSILTG